MARQRESARRGTIISRRLENTFATGSGAGEDLASWAKDGLAVTFGVLSDKKVFTAVVYCTEDQDAVDLLNSLQTPYRVLKDRRDAGIRIDATANREMRMCLSRIGYDVQSDLEKLNVVHVAGTKGKGTTCAYVDSILSNYRKSRKLPRSIGLFTSPHLIAVRERIRINSTPLSTALFAKYFFDVWDALEAGSAEPGVPLAKPVYFRYLTLMSYHVFLQEGVDAAVYETGVGGEYDSTNVIDHPVATGISTLGIDHTFALGETIDKIAWHKAGIQKPGALSFSVNQLPVAMEVIERRAQERHVKSFKVVDLDPRLRGVNIRPDAIFQKSNASLAIALAQATLSKLDPAFKLPSDSLPKEFIDGLEQVVWRGRCETKTEGNITWYLDSAHTRDSLTVAARWFESEISTRPGTQVLIFNQQGHREAIELLEGFCTDIASRRLVKFDHVIFCTNAAGEQSGLKRDYTNHAYDSIAIASLDLQNSFAKAWRALDPSPSTSIHVLPSIEDALDCVRKLDVDNNARGNENFKEKDEKESKHDDGKGKREVHALITGSVHLVGRALGALEGVDAL